MEGMIFLYGKLGSVTWGKSGMKNIIKHMCKRGRKWCMYYMVFVTSGIICMITGVCIVYIRMDFCRQKIWGRKNIIVHMCKNGRKRYMYYVFFGTSGIAYMIIGVCIVHIKMDCWFKEFSMVYTGWILI